MILHGTQKKNTGQILKLTQLNTTIFLLFLIGNVHSQITDLDTTTEIPETISNDENDIIFIMVIAIIGSLLVLLIIGIIVFCCCPLVFCLPPEKETNDASATADFPTDIIVEEPWEPKKQMVMDAMNIGKVSVLEFTLKEYRNAPSKYLDEKLLLAAEDRLNEWKRNLNILKEAYKAKDIPSIVENLERLESLEIQDETGIYNKCLDLQEAISLRLTDLSESSYAQNEAEILGALEQLRNLGLSSNYINQMREVKHANEVLKDLRSKQLLQEKTIKEMEENLAEATARRHRLDIIAAIEQVKKAELVGVDLLVDEGQRVLKELDEEHDKCCDDAWQKLQDASQKRDATGLRTALRLCAEFGVDQAQIKEGEKLLKIVDREDYLLKEMKDLIALPDSAKLLEAIAVFRTPGLMLVDKTGDVEKAEQMLQEIREKKRLKRAKSDVLWRLQNAINIGDVQMIETMINALESLASLGEDIDQTVLVQAKSKMEEIRGNINHRERMESLKNAIARMISAENLPQLADLIEQMVQMSTDENFSMTTNDWQVLEESRSVLHDLRRKHDVKNELELTRHVFSLPQIPNSLDKLKAGIKTMTRLKEAAAPFDGLFRPSDELLLATATKTTKLLQEKVDKRNKVLEKLQEAVESENYETLSKAIEEAQQTDFIDEDDIGKAIEMRDFTNPKKRIKDLKSAMIDRDMNGLTKAIADFKVANVPYHDSLLEKAEKRLKKLKVVEKRKKKEEKLKKREEEKHRQEINALNDELEKAMDSRDIDELQKALEKCENSGYSEDHISLQAKADELLDKLTIDVLRKDLLENIKRRDILGLETSIDQAEYGGYIKELAGVYSAAKDLLFHLRELHAAREAISGMNKSIISEIARYPTPPHVVGVVMSAVMILLGEKKEKVFKWSNIQNLLNKFGNQSLTRRVKRCSPGDITPDIRSEVEDMLEGLTYESIAEKSSSAASFFAWMQCMIKESYYVIESDGDQ